MLSWVSQVLKEVTMPKVGKKHFSYSSAGRKKAATYAKKTGKKMTNTRKKRKY
tara:strand:+ start:202 stop:360 length:159 start_codon:yes stop_codon:yes gene_type:complete